jgi:hypothetical protein
MLRAATTLDGHGDRLATARAADVRVPAARWIVVGAAMAVCVVLLVATRTFTFYFDEWSFITTAPDWTLRTYFEPHNEHPVMLLRAVYALLLNTVGLRSYVPYMAALLIAHGATVVLLFEVVRRRAGELIALAAAALLLVIGAGWEDLLWAFQLSFVASAALGLAALLAADSRRAPLAAALVAASLMFSALGLFFGVAVTVLLVLERERRGEALSLVPVGVALAVWYAVFGRSATDTGHYAANVAGLPAYVAWGLAQSAGGLVGLSGWAAAGVAIASATAVAVTWWRRGVDAFAVGVAVGLVAFYVVTGVSRGQLGYQQAGAGRYVYVGAAFWLLLLADAARALPWHRTWRPALAAIVFLATFNSAVVLVEYTAAKTVQMQRQVADLQAYASARSDGCVQPNTLADPLVMPYAGTPAAYYRAVDRYGDPVAGLAVTDKADYEVARRNLGCTASP